MSMLEKTNRHIRRARPEDASVIANIHVDSWQATYKNTPIADELTPQKLHKTIHVWQERLEKETCLVYVIVQKDRIIGFSAIGKSREHPEDDKIGEIYAIYLKPSCFRKGYGKALMKRSTDYFKKQGYQKVHLWVLNENKNAIAFYLNQGFSLSGKEKKERIGENEIIEMDLFFKL